MPGRPPCYHASYAAQPRAHRQAEDALPLHQALSGTTKTEKGIVVKASGTDSIATAALAAAKWLLRSLILVIHAHVVNRYHRCSDVEI